MEDWSIGADIDDHIVTSGVENLQNISLIATKAAIHTNDAEALKGLVDSAAISGGYELAFSHNLECARLGSLPHCICGQTSNSRSEVHVGLGTEG
jgi:hypothetical protein